MNKFSQIFTIFYKFLSENPKTDVGNSENWKTERIKMLGNHKGNSRN